MHNISHNSHISLNIEPTGSEMNKHQIQKDPPSVLVMRRESIRTFPGGKRVAIYYVKELNKYIPISYDDNDWNGVSESIINDLYSNVINEKETLFTFNNYDTYILNVNESALLYNLYNELNENNKPEFSKYIMEGKTNLLEMIQFSKSHGLLESISE